MTRALYHWFLFSCGVLALVIGVIALIIPLVPTTPFLILAAYCFSKSSPKFRNWMIHHRVLGPPILEWEEHKVIRPKQKALAVSMMSISLSYPIFFMSIPLWAKLSAAVVGISVIGFILTRKSAPNV